MLLSTTANPLPPIGYTLSSKVAHSRSLNLSTITPPGLGGPTATTSPTSPTSHHELDINTTISSAQQLPTTLSAKSPSFFPGPRRAPQDLLPSVDDYAPAAVSYATVATTAPTRHLPSTSHDVFDTRAQDVRGPVEAAAAPSAGDNTTPRSSPRGLDRRTASSPTSVAETIQPHCFPASQKPGKYKIEMCRNLDKPGGCPFGKRCTYAHGPHELRTKPLLTQHREGKLDANSYRRYPCFDQVSGGAW